MKKIILFLFITIFLNTLSNSNAVAKTYKYEKCIVKGLGMPLGDEIKWSKKLWQKTNVSFFNSNILNNATSSKEIGNSIRKFYYDDKPKNILKKLNKNISGWKIIKNWEKSSFTVNTNNKTIISYLEFTTDKYNVERKINSKYRYYGEEIRQEKKYFTKKYYITDSFDDYIRGSVTAPWGQGKFVVLLNFKTGIIETYYSFNNRQSIKSYYICKPLNYSSSKSSGTFSKTFSYWWVVFILIALGGFIYTQLKPGKSKKVKISKSKISSQKNVILTFIPKLWRGEFPLAISFWVCWIIPSMFFSLVVLVPVTGTVEIILGYFVLFFYIYAFIAIRGTWYSANHYKAEKEKKNQTYGWASAAHIYIFLSVIGFIIRIFRLIL